MRKTVSAVLAVAIVVTSTASAQTGSGKPSAKAHSDKVPTKLFDISLGTVFKLPRDGFTVTGSLPVKRITGAEPAFGAGMSFYLEPVRQYPAFPYSENKKTPDDQAFATSFRIYALSVIPASVKRTGDLEKLPLLDFEVLMVEWSDPGAGERQDKDPEASNAAYSWASEICRTFELDLKVKPEILDIDMPGKVSSSKRTYTCRFEGPGRTLEVSSMWGRVVKLAYDQPTIIRREQQLGDRIRQLKAPEIRPY